MKISKALGDSIANALAARCDSGLCSVSTELLDDGTFLFITADLPANAPLNGVGEVSRAVRELVATPTTVDPEAWGAAIRYRGKVVHVIHAGNTELHQ